MLRPKPIEQSARVFAALGDRTRLELVGRLSEGAPISILHLTRGTAISRQAVSKHLVVLQKAGLVRGVRRGRENLFELTPGGIEEARAALENISRQWEEALGRLKEFVEKGDSGMGEVVGG